MTDACRPTAGRETCSQQTRLCAKRARVKKKKEARQAGGGCRLASEVLALAGWMVGVGRAGKTPCVMGRKSKKEKKRSPFIGIFLIRRLLFFGSILNQDLVCRLLVESPAKGIRRRLSAFVIYLLLFLLQDIAVEHPAFDDNGP